MTAHLVADSSTMSRRNLVRIRRYPSMTLLLVAVPIVLLVLFVYVFGGTLGDGLTGGGGRAAYLDFVVPGLIAMALASAVQGTAISVAMDVTSGIVDRFRSMDIARPSVLAGHVLGSLAQAALCVVGVVAAATLLGFRSDTGPLAWLAAAALIAAFGFAPTWVSVAMGLASDSVETASNLPMVLSLLPFLGGGFVPTDSLPTPLAWFARYQPFTPLIGSLRGLLTSGPVAQHLPLAVGWIVVLTVGGAAWSVRRFRLREA